MQAVKILKLKISGFFILIILLALFLTGAGFAKAHEPIRLHIWEQDPPELSQEMDKWITVYTRDKPWLTIVRQHFENEELRTRFLRSAVTGEGADIVYGPSDLVGVFATANVIQNLDGQINTEDFDPSLIRLMTYRQKLWGIPLSSGSHLVLYYNRQIIDKAPASFEELIGAGQKFMLSGPGRFGLSFYQSEPFWFVPFLAAFGAWPLERQGNTVQVSIQQKGTAEALDFLIALKDEYKVIPEDCDFECAKALFLGGKTPFHINGDWEISALIEHFGEDLGIAPLPLLAQTGNYLTPMVGGRFLYFNAKLEGAKKEAALDFARFTTTLPIQIRLATRLNRIPGSLKAREHPFVKSSAPVQALIEGTKHARDFPNDIEMRAAWDGMRIMIQRALSGREKPEQAVKTGQRAALEALAALKKTPISEQ